MSRGRALGPEFAPPLMPCNVPVRRCPVPRAQASRRILIMRLGAFGDILMATPLLAALREAWPDAHLTWLVERGAREAMDANPYIDELLLWTSSFFRKALRRGSPILRPLWAWRAQGLRRLLRAAAFDVFISYQPEEWPFLTPDVAAPQSIGVFDTYRQFYRATQTSPHVSLYSAAYRQEDLPAHRTDQYLLPLQTLGLPSADKKMQMGFTVEDEQAAQRWLRENHVSLGERFVVVAPFTTWPSRCWPAERYVELVNALTEQGHRVILIGSVKEQASVEQLAARASVPPLVAAGTFGFRQIAALIRHAALVVSGDTGPMHVASAVGTPYVALFGPTSTSLLAPLAGGGTTLAHAVPCGPCSQKVCPLTGADHMQCMRLIELNEVLDAVSQTIPTAMQEAAC